MSAPPATDAVVVPATPLLLPENRSLRDPVAGVRAVAAAAVRWLAERHPERVVVLGAPCGAVDRARGVTRPSSLRVAGSLLEVAGFTGRVEEHAPPGKAPVPRGAALLVVADGTACRDPEAPGRLDPRAAPFDDAVETALRHGDVDALRGLDEDLGRALLCSGVPALRALGSAVARPAAAHVDYAGHPFGVQYWVVRWSRDRETPAEDVGTRRS
jgi:hypothetical protein